MYRMQLGSRNYTYNIVAAIATLLSFNLFSACGSGADTDSSAGVSNSFRVVVTGAFNLTLMPPVDRVYLSYNAAPEDVEGFPASHTFRFVRPDQSEGAAVTIVFYGTKAPAAGTYPIEASENLAEGSVIANFSDRTSLSTFGAEPKGTITLERDGKSYSGRFSFTVQDSKTYPSEASVTVDGEFKDLTLETD